MIPEPPRHPYQVGLHVSYEGNTPVLHVRGDVDLTNAELLHDAVLAISQTEQRVVIDLTDVAFIDLRGLEDGVIAPSREARQLGSHVSVRNPPRSAIRIFTFTHLDDAIAIDTGQ